MDRLQRRLKYFGKKWTVRQLFPADFLSVEYWPFSYYRLLEDNKPSKKAPEIKRNWNLKPKEMIDTEAKLAASVKRAVMFGLAIYSDQEYEKIKEDEQLHSLLLAEIYALTYELKPEEKYFAPIMTINKTFAESLAIKAKTMSVEPFSFMVDLSDQKPELYNPKRFDFNWLILGAGWERERREYEKAEREAKAQIRKR